MDFITNKSKTDSYKLKPKMLGPTKHYPTAVKEWPNNIYVFNKTDYKNSFTNKMLISKLVKGYFSLTGDVMTARSKRMRNLIKRFSGKRVYVSKAEVKYTNDKAIVNIYVFNREKQFFLRKLLMYKRKKYMYKLWKISKTLLINKKIDNDSEKRIKAGHIAKIYKTNTNRFMSNLRNRNVSKLKKIKIRSNLYPKLKFLRKSTTYLDLFMNNQINFYFFRVKGDSRKEINNQNMIAETYKTRYDNFYTWLCNKILINMKKKYSENKQFNFKDPRLAIFYVKTLMKKESVKNSILRKYLINYKGDFLKKNKLKKNIFYIKFLINQAKFGRLLSKLKIVLQNYLNRNIEINIFDLKYLQLNSDIFTESIIVKAKKKKASIAKVFGKSLSLAKTPEISYEYPKTHKLHMYSKFDVNNLHNTYKLYNYFLPYTNNKDVLHVFFKNLYSSLVKSFSIKRTLVSKNTNILNRIKYKWLKGVRLEAAGRLTKRFTASRSLYAFKYKGNLKATNVNALDPKKTIPVALLRNYNKSNCQYTFVKSKKRIGAFGVKGWISSY